MMRLLALLWLLAGTALAGVLFQVKSEVQVMEEELAGVQRGILRDQEAIHVLQAEWSYLNRPERLRELTRRYLDLQPVSGAQVASVVALPPRPEDMGKDRGALDVAIATDDRGEPVPLPRMRPAAPDGWRGAGPAEATPVDAPPVGAPLVDAPSGERAAPAHRDHAPTAPAGRREPQVAAAPGRGVAVNPVTGRPLPAANPTLISAGGER